MKLTSAIPITTTSTSTDTTTTTIWKLQVENKQGDGNERNNGTTTTTTIIEADVLIMAIGANNSCHKYIPNLPNKDHYTGKILHTSQVIDTPKIRSMLSDTSTKIVVIGGSKSAYDIVQLISNKLTWILRSKHYWTPFYLLCIPFFDRIAYYLLRGYHIKKNCRSYIIRLLDEYLMPSTAIGINKPSTSTGNKKDNNKSMLDDLSTGGAFSILY